MLNVLKMFGYGEQIDTSNSSYDTNQSISFGGNTEVIDNSGDTATRHDLIVEPAYLSDSYSLSTDTFQSFSFQAGPYSWLDEVLTHSDAQTTVWSNPFGNGFSESWDKSVTQLDEFAGPGIFEESLNTRTVGGSDYFSINDGHVNADSASHIRQSTFNETVVGGVEWDSTHSASTALFSQYIAGAGGSESIWGSNTSAFDSSHISASGFEESSTSLVTASETHQILTGTFLGAGGKG